MCSRQVAHLTGTACLKTPQQLIFNSAQEFEEIRSLRNKDGTWMRIYYRETQQSTPFLSALSVIGEALLKRAEKLGVQGIEHWVDIQKGSLVVFDELN